MKQLVRKGMIRIPLIDESKLKIFLQIKGEEELERLYDKVIAPYFGDRCCITATNNTLYDMAETILDNFDEFEYHKLFQDEKIDKDERILKLMGYIDDKCCVAFYKFSEEERNENDKSE